MTEAKTWQPSTEERYAAGVLAGLMAGLFLACPTEWRHK